MSVQSSNTVPGSFCPRCYKRRHCSCVCVLHFCLCYPCQLLDSFTIACVMVLSFFFLRIRYKLINLMGISLALIGIVCLVLATVTHSSSGESRAWSHYSQPQYHSTCNLHRLYTHNPSREEFPSLFLCQWLNRIVSLVLQYHLQTR